MRPRTTALAVGVPLLIALWVAALWLPMPYVTYAPGLTLDVLGKRAGHEIVQVTGRRVYRDGGQLRMTTVFVTQPEARVNVFQVLDAWLSPSKAVYPFAAIYRQGETQEQADQESAVQMVSSQDLATAAALRELGYHLRTVTKIEQVTRGLPADGALEVGDEIRRVQGQRIHRPEDVLTAVKGLEPGDKVTLRIIRDGKPLTVVVGTKEVDGKARMGILPAPSFRFPFSVRVDIDPDIGGPSAGLMFSLGIYDTLTPGSLTDGQTIAGTGTIDAQGKVGPIGGIAQKIVGAREAGARLFLVPPGNCDEAARAKSEGLNEDMRLVKAPTMHDAVQDIETWTADRSASLPWCTATDVKAAAS